MRVTGSITMVCRGIFLSEFRRRVGDATFQQIAKDREDEAGGGWAAREEDIDGDEFVHWTRDGEERRNDLAGNLSIERGVLEVGALEDDGGAAIVAHGGDVAGDGAIAEGDENSG